MVQTRKQKCKKFQHLLLQEYDTITISILIIAYYFDNSVFKLFIRYSLQYYLLNLNDFLDTLIEANQIDILSTSTIEDQELQRSLNNSIQLLRSRYQSSLKIGLLLFNGFCILDHSFNLKNLPISSLKGKGEYLHGFWFLNVIGQSPLNSKYPIVMADLLILCLQCCLYKFKFQSINQNHDHDHDHDSMDLIEDGFSGEPIVSTIDLVPNIGIKDIMNTIGLKKLSLHNNNQILDPEYRPFTSTIRSSESTGSYGAV
ncbi:hypothetical protein PACTADRAFT_48452 [Pachysolen tannophilus NRRL Y-2460]|uniref:DUF1746 domain-containing protein n=1 Tax=Pachysolen tannophilus NRRL Y-2460 TaxID=669874 RepID=A0A1E4TXW3_PACTA|nr:hypothetical protein PACTADRAFT_48452 [Pachysolen tannophilus NRRL Y-2460]